MECGVDDACSSVSGFGCGSGSLGTASCPIVIDSSSDEDEGPLPHWNDLPYDGIVEAPVGAPPFQLYCLLLTLDYGCALHFEFWCCDLLGIHDDAVPFGGMLPELTAPLPTTPGRVLHEERDAGAVWTTAPWSAAVLDACSCGVDGRTWLNELRWLASDSRPPLRSGWGRLWPSQVAGKLLVMWKNKLSWRGLL